MDVSVGELDERMKRGENLVLFDVREPHERAFCKIATPDTIEDLHIPMADIPAHLDEVRRLAAARSVFVYCHHGVRSRMVADWLSAQGVKQVPKIGIVKVGARSSQPAHLAESGTGQKTGAVP